MSEMANVIPGEPVASEWGNDIRDRTIQRYASISQRNTLHPAPTAGDLSYLQDSGAVELYHGGSWRGLIPTGAVVPFAGSTPPAGYLICNGGAISRTTYSGLFAVIGDTYGAGDGTTTFNLPDLRQRFPLGAGSAGSGYQAGATGGSLQHSHTNPNVNNDGSHGHAQGATATDGGGGNVGNTNLAHTHTVPGAGAHSHSFSDTASGPSGSLSVSTGTGPDQGVPSNAHTHSVSGTTGSAGSGGGDSGSALGVHSHVMPNHAHDLIDTNNAGLHGHTQGATGVAIPAFLGLHFIIRI